jgi:hypothetical protein
MFFSKTETKGETIEQVVTIPLEETEEQGIVIVHCRFEGEGAIRIWRSTILLDQASNHQSRLLHAENISLYPKWTPVSAGGHSFTLYFEGLPGTCKVFDLMEVIPQDGGFFIQGIVRNEADVYRVEIS